MWRIKNITSFDNKRNIRKTWYTLGCSKALPENGNAFPYKGNCFNMYKYILYIISFKRKSGWDTCIDMYKYILIYNKFQEKKKSEKRWETCMDEKILAKEIFEA